jgi:hypothetical protein
MELEPAPPPFVESFNPPSAPGAGFVLKGLEGIEFRDQNGFIWMSDSLGVEQGIMGFNYDEATGTRQILITDNVTTTPSSINAMLELASTKGAFLPNRLTTAQKNAFTTNVDGMLWYDTTNSRMSWRQSGADTFPLTGITNTSDITSGGGVSPSLFLSTTGVSAGSHAFPASITLDTKGRVTAITNGTAPVTTVFGFAPIASSGGTTPTLSLNNSGVTAGDYYLAHVTVDAHGLVTSIEQGSLTGSLGIVIGGGLLAPDISIADTTVAEGTYVYPSFTVNSRGQLTAAASGAINAGSGIVVSGVAPNNTISINNSGVTAGTYVFPSVDINAEGRITSASGGSLTAGAGIGITGTAPNNTISITTTGVSAGQYFGDALTVNTLGQVTGAVRSHCALSNYDTNQTIGTGADVAVIFDGTNQVTCDAGGWHSNSVNNTRITPGVIGHFIVNISARLNDSATATYLVVSLLRNGTADLNTQAQLVQGKPGTNSMNASFSVVVETQLITDYFELSVRHNSVGSQSLTFASIAIARCG